MSAHGFSTFGVIGFGHFGEFLARSFAEHGEVLVTDVDTGRLPAANGRIRPAPLGEVARADVVVLAVPFDALEGVLEQIRDELPPTTVVMDVVSSKARPTALLRTVLEGHPNVLATHPLFGPPSMERIEPGLRIIVTHTEGARAKELRDFLETGFGLQVIELSPDVHDHAMAYMQAIPFFIARAIADLDIPGQLPDPAYLDALAIPSFEKLWRIVDIEQHHSPGMFETSQQSNPYADEARRRFLKVIEQLQDDLSRE